MRNALAKGRPLPELKYVSPDLLEFDPENPRFGGMVSGKTQGDIQKHLFGEPHYASELVDSLRENGFIDYEPLVVKRVRGKFVVIEGNRRLAAIREIRANPARNKGNKSDLESIPVLVFPARPDAQQRNEMRVYLGVRHLLGFREWPPISKAEFLERASREAGSLEQVIKEVHMTRTKVRRFLVPYRLLNHAKITIPKGEDFWVLGEALQRSGIKQYLQLEVDPTTLEVRGYDKSRLGSLMDALYGPRKAQTSERDASARIVHDTRDLSRLAKVLGSDAAADVLHRGRGLDEAEIHVDSREESLERLGNLIKKVAILLNKISKGRKDLEGSQMLSAFKNFDASVKAFIKRHAKPTI